MLHPGAGQAGGDEPGFDHADDEAAEHGADDRRLAAENRRAADQHRRDRGQQIALPLVAEEVLVLQRQHDRRDGGEGAHQSEDLDLLAIDVDADDARDVVGVADEQRVLAEPVAGEDEPEKADDQRRPQRLNRERLQPIDARRRREGAPDDPLPHRGLFGAAQRIGLAAGEHRRHAGPEELRPESRHERGNADLGDDPAVDEADENAGGKAGDDRDPAEVILLEQHREDEAGEGDDRREAEIDLARADHEGEAGREQDQRRPRRKEDHVDVGPDEHLRRFDHEQRQQQREDDDDRQSLDPPKDRCAMPLCHRAPSLNPCAEDR